MVGDPHRCKQVSDLLLYHYGIYVQPINYPTVPRGTERLRFTPSPLHSDEDIEHMVRSLSAIWASLDLPRVEQVDRAPVASSLPQGAFAATPAGGGDFAGAGAVTAPRNPER
jgi:hypothetical protein